MAFDPDCIIACYSKYDNDDDDEDADYDYY
jgi:hypothetical protein